MTSECEKLSNRTDNLRCWWCGKTYGQIKAERRREKKLRK